MLVRPATIEDIPDLEELLKQVLRVHHDVRPDIFLAQGQKFSSQALRKMIEDGQPIFVYTDSSGHVLAHLFLSIEEVSKSPLVPRKTLFIDDLCVAKEARGQGIGHTLLQFARDYAKTQGCYNLTLHAWNDNQEALKFYQKEGFRAQVTTMEEIL